MPVPETVELTFEYTQDEYVKAERQYLFASKIITKTSVVVLALFLPFSFFYLFLSSFCVFSIILVAVALFAAAAGSAVYFYMPAYKFKQTAKFHEEYNMAFSSAGIKFRTPGINSEYKWSIYTEIWESADFYFLIQALRIYSIIPKRAFISLEEKQVFEALAFSNLKHKKFK